MNIVITGASKGIGKAIAEKFAEDRQGHQFFLCARNNETLQQTGNELQARFPHAAIHTKACDVGIRSDVKEFGNWVLKQAEKVDILVNNAGPFIPGNVSDEAEGVLEEMMATHLYGAYHLTRTILPAMIPQKNGYIISICSIASLQAYPNGGAYSIAKFALAGFTKNLRHEMKPHGIKVIAVYPGAAYTDSWSQSSVDPQRLMKAEDIAQMIYASTQLSPQACVEDIIIRPQLGDL